MVIPQTMALIFRLPIAGNLILLKKCGAFKDKVSRIAYHSLENLQDKLSAGIKCATPRLIQSMGGNEFSKQTFNYVFNA
jgi:hypothetical protein